MTSERTRVVLARYKDTTGTFYSDPINKMTRKELLGLVGWMIEDRRVATNHLKDHVSFLEDLKITRRQA